MTQEWRVPPVSPGRGNGRKKYSIKDENAAFLLYLEGATLAEVVEKTGISHKTIDKWANPKDGRPKWRDRRGEFAQKFQEKVVERQAKARVKEIEAAAKEHANLTKLVKNSAARELQRLDQEVAELLAALKDPDEKEATKAFRELRSKRYNRALASNLFASNIFKAIKADRTRLDMDNFDPDRDRKVKAVYDLQLTLNGKAVDIDKIRDGFTDQDPYEYVPENESEG